MARRKRGELQVFSVSFLDVISCALGGVLLLLLLSTQQSASQAKAFSKEVAEWRNRSKEAMESLQQAEEDLKKAGEANEKYAQAMAKIEEAQQALVGFRGELKNVVFVFDTSGSMATPAWPEYCDYLKAMVEFIGYESFNVIDFDSTVAEVFPGTMEPRSQLNIETALKFIDGFAPDGGTDTGAALERAMNLPDVDTVVLFSDGAPSGDPASIVARAVRQSNGKITINTVAMGNYMQISGAAKPYALFLQQLAHDTNGRWLPFD